MKMVLAAVLVIALAGCSTLNSWDRAKLLGPENLAPDSTAVIVASYNQALAAAQASPRDSGAIMDYIDASIGLTDTACWAWLDRVSAAERSLRVGGSGLDVTSALATTIMGIASATPIIVGSVGAAFTALAGYGHVLDTAVLTAPSTYAAQTRLVQIMDSAATSIRNKPGTTWLQAFGQVTRYSRLCSYGAIQAAVNDALATTETTVQPSGMLLTVPRSRQ